jgi:hypothetical protein
MMASDPKKKKLESLRTSIANLETQLTLFKGNTAKIDSIQRVINRFKAEIQKMKIL